MKFRLLIILFLTFYDININAQTFYDVSDIYREKIYEDEKQKIFILKLKSTDPLQINFENQSSTILECWTEWIYKKPKKYKNTYISLTKLKYHFKNEGSITLKRSVDYNAKGEVISYFDYNDEFEDFVPGSLGEIIITKVFLLYEATIMKKLIEKKNENDN